MSVSARAARMGALLGGLAVLTLTGSSRAGINIPSDGSDGAFAPAASVQIDLSQAVTGVWDQDNTAAAGKGVYDPVKWAVVFKYASVNVPTGVAVTFKNHPSGAPVLWLVQGDVTIVGSVNLNGAAGVFSGGVAEAGPGGFRGGAAGNATTKASGGFGPGGGTQVGGTPTFASGVYGIKVAGYPQSGEVYGNPQVLPLLGGSGGAGPLTGGQGGGAGGGAILIGCGGTVTINGDLTANGGATSSISGSGGGVRIIADAVKASAGIRIYAGGNVGNNGRVRIEANTFLSTVSSTPAASTFNLLGAPPVIWPPANLPTVTITQIAGANAPVDPHAMLSSPEHYATISSIHPVLVRLNATNVPLTWNVVLRVVPFTGPDFLVPATNVSGDGSASVWEATITAPFGVSALQVRASKPS